MTLFLCGMVAQQLMATQLSPPWFDPDLRLLSAYTVVLHVLFGSKSQVGTYFSFVTVWSICSTAK